MSGRHTHSRTCAVWLPLAALLLSVPAAAAPSVSLVWSSTTGTGTPGSSLIGALPGDVLALDIVVTTLAGEGLSAASVGLAYESFGLLGMQAGTSECPLDIPNAACFSPTFLAYPVVVAGVVISNIGVGSTAGSFDILKAAPPWDLSAGSYVIGRMSFTFGFEITTTVSTNYIPGIDGIADGIGGPAVTPAASATALLVPEPGTASLLTLGLAALAWRRRRLQGISARAMGSGAPARIARAKPPRAGSP